MMKQWLCKLWHRLNRWTEVIEDRGGGDIPGREETQRAVYEALERGERVKGVKAEVRIVARKYE